MAYSQLMRHSELLDALMMSILIATSSATIATLIGGGAAFAFIRRGGVGAAFYRSLSVLPLVLPEIVFGLGLLVWFVFLRISLGGFSLILAHVTFSVSYVALTVRGRMESLDESIFDAARDLGASTWQLLLRVQLPLIAPALLAGWMLAFTLSFDDFLLSFFTSGPEAETLPLGLYAMIRFGVSPEIFAMSTVIFAVTLVSAIMITKLTRGRAVLS
jgi:ABC-type spermidine/putrescine transport system permease subunit II